MVSTSWPECVSGAQGAGAQGGGPLGNASELLLTRLSLVASWRLGASSRTDPEPGLSPAFSSSSSSSSTKRVAVDKREGKRTLLGC